MSKSMFAHPLDLIMIYLGNICSNVPGPSVLSLINVSELEMGHSSIISHPPSVTVSQTEILYNGTKTGPCPNLLIVLSLILKIYFSIINWSWRCSQRAREQKAGHWDEFSGWERGLMRGWRSQGRQGTITGKLSLLRGKSGGWFTNKTSPPPLQH